MFGLFKKKSKLQVLQDSYEKLLRESFELSKINRTESDKKVVEAQAILEQIETYKK